MKNIKVKIEEKYSGNVREVTLTYYDEEHIGSFMSSLLDRVQISHQWMAYPSEFNPSNDDHIALDSLIDNAMKLGISPVELLQKLVDHAHRNDKTTLWEGTVKVE
jgi:hypothetical protein